MPQKIGSSAELVGKSRSLVVPLGVSGQATCQLGDFSHQANPEWCRVGSEGREAPAWFATRGSGLAQCDKSPAAPRALPGETKWHLQRPLRMAFPPSRTD